MLRTKIRTILILLLAGLALTVIFQALSRRTQLRTFDEHDLAMARQNMQRVTSIFLSHLEDLSLTVPDWAFWDDTYEFASGLDPAYVEANLGEDVFENLRIDSFIILDPSSRPVYSREFDHEKAGFRPASSALLEALSQLDCPRGAAEVEEACEGLLILPEGPMAFVREPILTSAMKGPSTGFLVMTRKVTDKFLARVGEVAQVDLSIASTADSDPFLGEKPAGGSSGQKAPIIVRARDGEIIEGYSLLTDVRGSPSLTLTALLPRPMKTLGTPLTASLVFNLLALTLLTAFVAVVMVDRMILSRLASLSRQVKDVKRSGLMSQRLAMTGGDELAQLSGEINLMLDSLEDAHEEVESRERLLKEALRDKELLLKELHHRIKNNLHAVSSLFGARMPLIRDQAAVEALRQSQHFVLSMALIHQHLYEAREGLGIDFGRYLETLGPILVSGYGRTQAVELTVEADKVLLNPDTALPMGLVSNELITNCLKHAFPSGRKGRIHLCLRNLGGAAYQLEVRDNGIGLHGRAGETPFSSFGLLMVEGVVDQLGGRMTVDSDSGGVRTTVTFRLYSECSSMGL